MKRWLAFALVLCAGAAYAQVPPTGSGTNGWLQAIFNQLANGSTSGNPKTNITGVFSGADTTSSAATLASATGKTTFICGFSISGLGSTAGGPVTATVATIVGGNTLSYSYVFAASATTANTPVSFNYNPCLPASAAAAAITVTVPGQAGNTATQINAWGYQL